MDMQFGFRHAAYDRAQWLVHHEVFLVGGEEKMLAQARRGAGRGAASSNMYAVYRKMAGATGATAAPLSAHALELSYDGRKGAGKLPENAVVFFDFIQ
jgi:hypothetical protein